MLILSLTHLPTTLASCVTYSHTLGDDDVLLPSGDIDTDSNSDDDNDNDDEKDSDDSDDEDESLGQLRRLSRKSQLDYWCKRHKPLKNETEDEFAKRAMLMVDRGLVAQNKLRKLKDNQAKWVNQEEEGNIDIGIGARIFYEGIHGRSHTKPKKIVEHKDMGPPRGRQYRFLWCEVGYGGATRKEWKGPDWALKYPDLVESYEKVFP